MRNGRTHAFPARRSSDLPRAERQLAEVPIALDPRTVPAADATRRAASVLAAAAAALDLLVEEGAILSEALGVEVSDLPFERLHELADAVVGRSEEHTSELQSLMRISYAVFCLKKKIQR